MKLLAALIEALVQRNGTVRIVGFAWLILLCLASGLRAETILWDDLLKEIDRAGQRLASGEERKEVLAGLNRAIEANPDSDYLEAARRLARDLAQSKEAIGKAPEKHLLDTKIPLFAIGGSDKPLRRFMEQNPRDPATMILRKGRKAIGRLLPLLSDHSPTRSYRQLGISGEIPTIPRVCDVALRMIEFFSQCTFHFNASTGQLFHELEPEVQRQRFRRIEKWWRENKDRSLSDGIRAQLPHGDFYGQVSMAKNLARLGESRKDKEYALGVLRELVHEHWGHTAAHAARALAEFKDYSPVDVFYTRWKASLDQPGRIYDSHVVFYLTDHGGRREWELLHGLATREIQKGMGPGTARVWPALVNCRKADSSPYAIPGLALALNQSDGYAETAVELLQKQTGIDFGYRRGGTAEEKAAAVRRAREWWAEKGEAKYTFESIEEKLIESDT